MTTTTWGSDLILVTQPAGSRWRPWLAGAAVLGLAAAATLGAAGLTHGQTPAAVAADSWRAPGYGPAGARWNPAETRATIASLPTLEQRWSYTSPIIRSPLASEGCPLNGGAGSTNATVRPWWPRAGCTPPGSTARPPSR
jgi:hypothetical protein